MHRRVFFFCYARWKKMEGMKATLHSAIVLLTTVPVHHSNTKYKSARSDALSYRPAQAFRVRFSCRNFNGLIKKSKSFKVFFSWNFGLFTNRCRANINNFRLKVIKVEEVLKTEIILWRAVGEKNLLHLWLTLNTMLDFYQNLNINTGILQDQCPERNSLGCGQAGKGKFWPARAQCPLHRQLKFTSKF